ncbi:MAG: diacylglycerol/polyprenol kinase family protein [Treponemataceae bacterium]
MIDKSITSVSQKGIFHQRYIRDLRKELFRKSIHICTLFVPLLAQINLPLAISLLIVVLVAYLIAEFLRLRGKSVLLFTVVTMAAARKRDENRFVLGPVTLCLGVLCTISFFNDTAAAIGICALALGDGVASIIGKFCGRIRLPFLGGKTVEGCLACYIAVFFSTFFISKNVLISLVIAFVSMIIEMIPLKDLDNLFIPIIAAGFTQYFFSSFL